MTMKGTALHVHQDCLACGTTCLVTANLFPGEDDLWECPRCLTRGTIAHFHESADAEAPPDR
jgi:hypothetical protein